MQFADYAVVPDDMKAQTLDFVCAAVHGVQVRSNGGKIVTFDIGELLNVTAQRYATIDEAGVGRVETLLLRKHSGTHPISSLSIYDKAIQSGMTRTASKKAWS